MAAVPSPSEKPVTATTKELQSSGDSPPAEEEEKWIASLVASVLTLLCVVCVSTQIMFIVVSVRLVTRSAEGTKA